MRPWVSSASRLACERAHNRDDMELTAQKSFPVSPQNPLLLPHETPLCSNSKASPTPNSTKIIRSATIPHHPPGLPGFSRCPPPSSRRREQKQLLGNYLPIVSVAMASPPGQPPPSPPSPPSPLPPRRGKRSRSPSGERDLGARFDPQLPPPGPLGGNAAAPLRPADVSIAVAGIYLVPQFCTHWDSHLSGEENTGFPFCWIDFVACERLVYYFVNCLFPEISD